MDYSKHYQQLITKHGSTNKPDNANYYEKHHIIPKSLGGSDDADNLVYLTGKAHYVAHYLLFKIHGVGPMSHAFWVMSAMDKTGKRHVPNGLSFEVARKAHAASQSGENHYNYGKALPTETRAKMSVAHLGRTFSPETRAKLSAANSGANHYNYGKALSPQTRAKLSVAMSAENNSFYGKTHSFTARSKIGAARARPANVYCAKTDGLIACNVTLSKWTKQHGYTNSALVGTTIADRTKPSSKKNPHYHKGIYAVYIDKE